MKFTNRQGLTIDFNPAADLEVEYRRGRWCQTSVEMFRSWGGRRRVNGQEYNGPVYNFLTNKIATMVNDPAGVKS